MAGAGYKLFNTGDVLTAAQVNTYLQEQVVMVFANATARTTALSGVLAEGMMSYLQDTNAVEVYDGSSWISIGSTGDITSVTAGVGISGGGTSGAVTITNDMATTITAAGDIVVGTGSGTYDNLPIGTTGQILTADTTVSPYKVKWATAASSGGMTLISTTTLSGASTTINSFSGYNDLLVVISGITYNTADEIFQIRPNASSSLAYAILNRNANNVTYANAISDATINTLNDPKRSGGNNAFVLELKNYATTSYHKPYKFYGGCETSTEWVGFHSGGFLKTNSAITSLVLQTASGYTLTGGQVLTYGVK